MNCGRFKKLLWSYVEGILSVAERQVCEAHLTHCARCRQRLQAAQLTRASLQALPRYAAPERLLKRVRAEIPAQRGQPTVATMQGNGIRQPTERLTPVILRHWRWALAPALGALIALLWWWSHSPVEGGKGYAASQAQEYADTCVDLHQQLEMVEWAGTPTASYLVTTDHTQ